MKLSLPESIVGEMKKHLAILTKPAIEAILMGKKTIETRFSRHKIAPFGRVEVGDLIYIKPPGEDLIGQFKAKKIIYFAGLEEKDMEEIFRKYDKQIGVGDQKINKQYQTDKKYSKFGTLIFIEQSERFITAPIKIKKKDLRGWVVIE